MKPETLTKAELLLALATYKHQVEKQRREIERLLSTPAQAEVARMRPVFKAGLALFNNKRHGLSRNAGNIDCEGPFWILRPKWRDVEAFVNACAKA